MSKNVKINSKKCKTQISYSNVIQIANEIHL